MQYTFEFGFFLCKKRCVTTCHISGKQEEVVGQPGAAICMPNDEFDAEIGRRIAIANAVRRLPRKQRKEIFAAYEKGESNEDNTR